MKKRKVISPKNLPMRPPLIGSFVCWMVLDKLNATGWVWGVFGTLFVTLWILFLIDTLNRQDVEVIKEDA